MSRRLYLSRARIIDRGEGPEAICDALLIAGKVNSAVQYIAQNPDGSLRLPWGFVAIDAANHLPIIADPNTRALPDLTFDVRMDGAQAGAIAAMRAAYQHFGISEAAIDGALSSSGGFRGPIRALLQLIEPTANENNLV